MWVYTFYLNNYNKQKIKTMNHPSIDNFKVELLEISGFTAVREALRLPYGNKNMPKNGDPLDIEYANDAGPGFAYILYSADTKLISALVKRGDEHSKVLRGLIAYVKINAPRYWWVEMDTYKIGAERLSSESTMHIQGKGLDTDSLIEMKENLPESTMQQRVWMFSYQTLRRIYFQRKDHRLPQWRMFCDFIEKLPFAKEFITITKD